MERVRRRNRTILVNKTFESVHCCGMQSVFYEEGTQVVFDSNMSDYFVLNQVSLTWFWLIRPEVKIQDTIREQNAQSDQIGSHLHITVMNHTENESNTRLSKFWWKLPHMDYIQSSFRYNSFLHSQGQNQWQLYIYSSISTDNKMYCIMCKVLLQAPSMVPFRILTLSIYNETYR